MPPHRKHPAKASQPRNAKHDDPPMRTRYGRGAKSAPASQGENVVPPKASPNGSTTHSVTRKATRSSSNVSAYSSTIDVAAPEAYAKFHEGILSVYGLSGKFLQDLDEREERRLRKEKERKQRRWRMEFGDLTPSDLEHETSTSSEEDLDVESPPRPSASRGRGRGRGSRGRGGRGRGRGRGRGGSNRTRDVSPLRPWVRKTRNAAPIYPLSDEDGEESTNQESEDDDAKDSLHIGEDEDEDDVIMSEADDDEEDEREDEEMGMGVPVESTTPPGSPPHEVTLDTSAEETKASLSVPKIVQPKASTSQTPRNGGTPRATPTPKLLDPEDDALTDSDLPSAWIEDYVAPTSEADCEDTADFLLKTRYKPMIDVHELIANLTKFAPSQRSTESLYRLAENTQMILKAWQDEYLMLDARTAPHSHPPKKPANGGRVPVADDVYEDIKESDLYSYNYDPKKTPGTQDPFAQRAGAEKSGGRELRQRRARDMLDSAAPSEEEEEEESEARGVGRRQRRATRRFEDVATGTSTPKKNNGWGGKRVKGVSRFAQDASATPEPDSRAAKRQKVNHSSLLHQRIQEMREQSAVTSSGDEASSQDPSEGSDEYRKRGRPAGSKNLARRSDYGVKKGPRKRVGEPTVHTTGTQASNVPPPVLQSLSEGQNQFSIDPQPPPPGIPGSVSTPASGPQPVSTVFQATPQPPGAHEATALAPPPGERNPDAYMNTTPLSQYSHPYADQSPDTSGSGKRTKPRVKSEKRSQSMTIWWAERKARQKELEEKANPTGVKQEANKPSTPKPAGRRGGRTPSAGRPEQPTPPQHHHQQQQPYAQQPEYRPQEAYPTLPPPHIQPLSAPSPNIAYAQTAPPPHYPHQMLMQPTSLAAMPSGPFTGPTSSGPPPPGPAHAQLSPLGPTGSQPPPMSVPRGTLTPLAPAPMPPQPLSYPSPYGPRTAPRPKSSGPPPLAPAPAHVSPYPPSQSTGPVSQREIVEMPFKVLIPGPPPSSEPERR